MIFSSALFLFFFCFVFLIHWYGISLLRNRKIAINFSHVFLLICSYAFYMAWDWRFGGLMLFSTLVDYLVGLGISARPVHKRLLLLLSVIINLGVLGYFKYADFFIGSFLDLLDLVGLSLPGNPPRESLLLSLILPLGISFFTFQSMSYTIDVYRGTIPVERSFLRFALFVSFFPQLVAGPIVMARTFLPQLASLPEFSPGKMRIGMRYFALGYFKKVVLADNMAPIVDQIYSNPALYDTAGHWLGAFAFWVQVYGDFSGYSDMAWGTAILLGYHLPENFRLPYLSTSVTEHWQRWHISLIAWIRDYLYIPLGGNRVSFFRHKINIFLTMFLAGLWHGANWTYVIWGAIHGSILVMEATYKHFLNSCRERGLCRARLLPVAPGMILAFLATTFCTVFFGTMFRSQNIEDSWLILTRMLGATSSGTLPLTGDMYRPVFYSVLCIYLGHLAGKWIFERNIQWPHIPALLEAVFYLAFIVITWEIGARDVNAFIYFVF
ncbi:MAG: MBOAT family protein [Spirochaetales bacterium]|nr:MBOAT family protein [Spirochaetales bacterium]